MSLSLESLTSRLTMLKFTRVTTTHIRTRRHNNTKAVGLKSGGGGTLIQFISIPAYREVEIKMVNDCCLAIKHNAKWKSIKCKINKSRALSSNLDGTRGGKYTHSNPSTISFQFQNVVSMSWSWQKRYFFSLLYNISAPRGIPRLAVF
jgi:hypothetical protein